MRMIKLLFILPVIFGIYFLSCNQANTMIKKNYDMQQQVVKENSLQNITDADELLQMVENKYSALTFYKVEALNIYSRKGFGEEESVKREIEIEYSSPSQLKAEMRDDKNTKTLISNNSATSLWINGEKREDYDDIYWGLTSTEFGDGVFFEIGKILILKERERGKISSFMNLKNLMIVGEEIIDQRPCYKIQGAVKTDDLTRITYWIDKESFLIRQYEKMMLAKKIPNGYFKTVESYTNIETQK